MIRRYLFLCLLSLLSTVVGAQNISHQFRNTSMADALKYLQRQTKDYKIVFIYDDLEDFQVSTHVKNKPLPEAIRQLIGFYPIRMSQTNENEIYVECTHKTDRHLTGTIVDENRQPMPYANVALLNPLDSTVVSLGVSNESGVFVVPYELPEVIARISCVGYRVWMRLCRSEKVGQVQLVPAEYSIHGVVVKGNRIVNHVDKQVYTFTAEQIGQARNVRDLLEKVEDLQINPVTDKVQRMDGGAVKILLNGLQASDIDLKSIPANKILKVEYYEIPPARYADGGTLVVVRTRRLDTGVSGGVDAKTAFTTGFTDDAVYLNLTEGNHQLSFDYIFSLRDYTKAYQQMDYDYTLGQVENHYQAFTRGKFGYTTNMPDVKYTYNKADDVVVQVAVSPSFDTQHRSNLSRIALQRGDEQTTAEGERKIKGNSFGPSMDVYLKKFLPRKQELEIDLLGTFYHNSMHDHNLQTVQSDGSTLLSDAMDQQSNKASFIGELAYTKEWNTSALSMGYKGTFGRSRATISNVLSAYEKYHYSSASYSHYMYAEYAGKLSKLMYRIGLGAKQVTTSNDDTRQSHWLATPTLVLSHNPSRNTTLRLVLSSSTNTPSISSLSNNAQLLLPDVLSVGNPYLKSFNSYYTGLTLQWRLPWLFSRFSFNYNYTDSPIHNYYTEQTILGRQYIVGMLENANYSASIGGGYLFTIKPFSNDMLSISIYGDVVRQSVSSHITGHYAHTYAPLNYSATFRKGVWGAFYQGRLVSRYLSGTMLSLNENFSALGAFWQKGGWRLFAECYWLFTRSKYGNKTYPGSILQSSSHNLYNDNRSMIVVGFSWNFSSGKNINTNRKLQNTDSDKGIF